MTHHTHIMLRSLLGATMLAGAGSSAALAQAAAPSPAQPETKNGGGIAEIVVTAQRRSESVQKTPIAITAFTNATLRARGIETARDLATQTPSFSVRGDSGNPGVTVFSIRGLGQNSTQLEYQPAVALYEDGVYATTSQGGLVSGGFYDVQRVEVLKGPQGTLFGRNSTGGAISVVTKLPTGKLGGEIESLGGSNGQMGLNGVLNLPISGNDVGLRIVGQYKHSDGYGRDLTSGTRLNTQDLKAIRATFHAALGRFDLILRGDYAQGKPGPVTQRLESVVPGSPIVDQAALQFGIAKSFADLGNPAILEQARQALLAASAPKRFDARYGSFIPYVHNKDYGASATLAYNLTDNLQLKSISAFRRSKDIFGVDNEANPVTVIQGEYVGAPLKQYTEELQFNGSAFSNRLKFATGLFYYQLKGEDILDATIIPALNPTNPLSNINAQNNVSKAAYGQATFTIIDGLNLTGGVRYTDESVKVRSSNLVSDPVLGPLTVCTIPAELQTAGTFCEGRFKVDFTNWSYTAGLDYQVNRDILVYGKVSRGFKAGGYNTGTGLVSFGAFRPELATTYEVGFKSDLLDHHVRANVALYQTDYKDIQRLLVTFDALGNAGNRVLNAASARVRGAEAELTLVPVKGIELNGGIAYTDPKYNKYLVAGPAGTAPVDRSFERFPNVPKWQLNFAASYTAPLPIGSLRFAVDGAYQSFVQFDPADQGPLSNGAASQPGYTLVNGRVTLFTDHDNLEVEAFVTNIFDKRYLVTGLDLKNSLGYSWNAPGAPRMWALKVTKRF